MVGICWVTIIIVILIIIATLRVTSLKKLSLRQMAKLRKERMMKGSRLVRLTCLWKSEQRKIFSHLWDFTI